MITKLTIQSFKTLESVEVELGQINVFVGANGSGKSNLLEALGVLSAAAAGRVDDESLLRRGVRPGVPKLYKSAFPGPHQPKHIAFCAENANAAYGVTLWNPLAEPSPAWRYKTELWQCGEEKIVGRSPASGVKTNPEAGLAALKAVDRQASDPAMELLDLLRGYAIYTPHTPTLRGTAPEQQPREPAGLSGGGLPQAVARLLRARRTDELSGQAVLDIGELIDWAASFDAASADRLPLSPAAAASREVVRFYDRFMAKGRNVLSGYDASEGALYVLFAAVLALDDRAPGLLAIDNVDHGLNPRLVRRLISRLCEWSLSRPSARQWLLTTHNPLVLDGLPLADDRARLFTVDRTAAGRTAVRRITWDDRLAELGRDGWTLSRLWLMGHLGGVPNV